MLAQVLISIARPLYAHDPMGVDLETGVVVGVTVQGADQGDTTTIKETLVEAAEEVETVLPERDGIEEVVTDTCACSFRKGYYSTERLQEMKQIGLRTYISEPKRGHRKWDGNTDARDAVYANRRRIRGNRGKQLLRRARRTTGTSGGPICTARAECAARTSEARVISGRES